jgi:hypothetical protein
MRGYDTSMWLVNDWDVDDIDERIKEADGDQYQLANVDTSDTGFRSFNSLSDLLISSGSPIGAIPISIVTIDKP